MSSWRRSNGHNIHGIFCRRWGWQVHVDCPKLLYSGPWRQKHHPNMTTPLSVTAETKQQCIRRVACTSQTTTQSDTLCIFQFLACFWRAYVVDVWNSLTAPLKRYRRVAQVKIRESQVFQKILHSLIWLWSPEIQNEQIKPELIYNEKLSKNILNLFCI